MSKQFGLIIPGQQKPPVRAPPPVSKPSIFDESSSGSTSNDEAAPQMRPKPSIAGGPSLMERRVARRMQEKALAEDPTIFQYDELYDDMDNKREEAKQAKSQEPRKPKYIGRLMEHAERRKLENELRVERQVQKEREAEGEMYKDKDTYVTATYRKKLESIRLMQEQDKRDDYLEAIGDVTKQKDLDGFYRHLYEQKLGTQKEVIKPKTAPSEEEGVAYKPITAERPTTTAAAAAAEGVATEGAATEGAATEGAAASITAPAAKQRSYRRRRASEDEPAEQQQQQPKSAAPAEEAKAHLPNNIDADSDFSIDDSSDDEAAPNPIPAKTAPPAAVKAKAKQPELAKKDDKAKDKQKSDSDSEKSDAGEEEKAEAEVNGEAAAEEAASPKAAAKQRIDRSHIWLKRTVGDIFDEALAKYQLRKKARRA